MEFESYFTICVELFGIKVYACGLDSSSFLLEEALASFHDIYYLPSSSGDNNHILKLTENGNIIDRGNLLKLDLREQLYVVYDEYNLNSAIQLLEPGSFVLLNNNHSGICRSYIWDGCLVSTEDEYYLVKIAEYYLLFKVEDNYFNIGVCAVMRSNAIQGSLTDDAIYDILYAAHGIAHAYDCGLEDELELSKLENNRMIHGDEGDSEIKDVLRNNGKEYYEIVRVLKN